jgi:hypothetical protein
MRSLAKGFRRGGTALAATAAITLAGATMASAHHCYRDVWLGASESQLSSGKTPWMPLSDMGVQFVIGPDYAAQCGYVADDAVQEWMAGHGLTREPLVQTRATLGGGAYYVTGKEPQPFSYLEESDFADLTMLVVDGMATCAPEWNLPEEG